jgi:hypothetical protein
MRADEGLEGGQDKGAQEHRQSPQETMEVEAGGGPIEALNTIICCRAGYGLWHDPPNQFMPARLKSAFAWIHYRAQNAVAKRLFDLKARQAGRGRDGLSRARRQSNQIPATRSHDAGRHAWLPNGLFGNQR